MNDPVAPFCATQFVCEHMPFPNARTPPLIWRRDGFDSAYRNSLMADDKEIESIELVATFRQNTLNPRLSISLQTGQS
jgi:hypothetical protein